MHQHDKKDAARKAVDDLATRVRGMLDRIAHPVYGKERAGLLVCANRPQSDKTLIVWVFVPYNCPTRCTVATDGGVPINLHFDPDRILSHVLKSVDLFHNHQPVPGIV